MPLKEIVFLLSALLAMGAPGLCAQSMDGIIYVASVRGDVTSSLKNSTLKKGETLPAQNNTIKTGLNAFSVIVLSNGLSIYCGEDSELTIETFTQQPFDESSNSLEYETSRSELIIELVEGDFGISHRIPQATSLFQLKTKYGVIEPRSKAFAVTLQTGDAKLFVFEESARVELKLRDTSELIQSEQWINLLANASTRSAETIQRIQTTDIRKYQPWVTMATNMRVRTHFIQKEAGTIEARTIFPKEHFSRKAINGFEARSK